MKMDNTFLTPTTSNTFAAGRKPKKAAKWNVVHLAGNARYNTTNIMNSPAGSTYLAK